MDEKVKSIVGTAARILHRDPPNEIDPGKPLWNYFPRNRRYAQAKEVTEFCLWVANEYKVYLTEKEWQNPTATHLAEIITKKQNDPSRMLLQIEKVQNDFKKGLIWSCLLALGMGSLSLYLTWSTPHARPTGIALFFLFIASVVLLSLREKWNFYKEIKPVLNHYKNHQ